MRANRKVQGNAVIQKREGIQAAVDGGDAVAEGSEAVLVMGHLRGRLAVNAILHLAVTYCFYII